MLDERKVTSVHIGNVETGIILNLDDGSTVGLNMTEDCYKEQQKQAEDLSTFWKNQGAIEELRVLSNPSDTPIQRYVSGRLAQLTDTNNKETTK